MFLLSFSICQKIAHDTSYSSNIGLYDSNVDNKPQKHETGLDLHILMFPESLADLLFHTDHEWECS